MFDWMMKANILSPLKEKFLMKNMRIGKNGWITWRIDVKMHEEQIVACLFMAVILAALLIVKLSVH